MIERQMDDRTGKIKAAARSAAGAAARLLFPPVCPGCGRHVAAPGTLCGGCWPQLRLIGEPVCPVYGTPFGHEMGAGMLSAAAIADPPPFARARSAVAYDGVARQMVQSLKYRDRTDLAPWMAQWMIRAGHELVTAADVVVPVPLHRGRFFRRRFNQSAELARAVASARSLPFEPGAVVRVRRTARQVGLTHNEREANVRGAFQVPEEADILVRGRNILVIDDVYTTGATVKAVTRALKRKGAVSVDILTFARVLPGDFQSFARATI